MARNTSLANNNVIVQLFRRLASKIDDAPSDGFEHVRKDGAWVRNTDEDSNWNLDTEGGTIISSSGAVPYVKFEPTWDDLRVPITAVKLGGVNDPNFGVFQNDGGGSTGVYLYEFEPTKETEVFFVAQMPHGWVEGTAIQPHVHWIPLFNNLGDVRWGLEYNILAPNGSPPSATEFLYANASTESPVAPGSVGVDFHLISGLGSINMTGYPVSTMLMCRLFRNGGDAADTYTGDAGLLEFDFHYQKDSLGSNEQFSKT